MATSAAAEAEKLKNEGNAFFNQGRYVVAAARYSEAIMKEWERMKADAEEAMRIDGGGNAKACVYLGIALFELGKIQEGIAALKKGLQVAKRQKNLKLKKGIEAQLNQMKELGNAKALEQAQIAHSSALSFVQTLWDRHRATVVHETKEETAVSAQTATEHLEYVEQLFRKNDPTNEPPEHLCCGISLEIMKDPVITPSGHSYERSAIEAALQVRPFDPITREPLNKHQLLPNHGLRAAIEHFLKEYPYLDTSHEE